MRGKWIVPGKQTDLATGSIPNLAAWQAEEPANLLILTSDPRDNPVQADDLAGVVIDGEIRLFDSP